MSDEHFHSVNPEYLKQITVEHLVGGQSPEGMPVLDVKTVPSKSNLLSIGSVAVSDAIQSSVVSSCDGFGGSDGGCDGDGGSGM